MDEETTTDATVESGEQTIQGVAVDDQGMAISQPDEADEAEAGHETTETEQKPEEAPIKSKKELPTEEYREQLEGWAQKKGLTLDSDNARKAAEMAMEAERNMHSATGKASQALKKSMESAADAYAEEEAQTTGSDPDTTKTIKRLLVRDSLRDFWDANPGAKQHESELAKIVTERPYLAGDLEAAYALVQTKNAGDLKSQGKREALESLAHKQQAAVPTGNAVNPQGGGSSKITPQNVDQLVGQNSQEWFEKNYADINKAMAG